MSSEPIVYGAAYSAFVRSVRLALAEKGVAYRHVPVEILGEGNPPAEHLQRQPFGKIPAFEHDGFALYETIPILRYIDEVFPGPALQPGTAQERARVNQVMGILDAYAYQPMVWGIFVERILAPQLGRATDEATIEAAKPKATQALAAIEALVGEGPYLIGSGLTLADLHAVPMIAYLTAVPEGAALLAEQPKLSRWWQGMAGRPSVTATAPG